MSRLSDRLNTLYTEHYRRVNASVDPVAMAKRVERTMNATYGRLIKAVPRHGRVLDLGCGTGITLHWLSRQPGVVAVGVDSASGQVAIAQKALPQLDIICTDGLAHLRSHPNTYAGIICTDVLEHIETDELCFEWVEASLAALQPGGFFFCRVPNAANLFASYSRYMDLTHQRLFTSLSLQQLFEAAGFAECQAMPEKPAHRLGAVRQGVERLLHRILFRICGRGTTETVFTANVCLFGFRR